MNKKGFTLIELLIVIAILIIMIAILVGILNPIALINKARDSRRKKDLRRISISFEEYFNDEGCYPSENLASVLMNKEYCGTDIFEKWLRPWPCDPNGEAYQIMVGYDSTCPKWFKILARLENKSDTAINVFGVGVTAPNYAVSSGNISPGAYVGDNNPACVHSSGEECYIVPEDKPWECNSTTKGCTGPNCYSKMECEIQCQVSSCF